MRCFSSGEKLTSVTVLPGPVKWKVFIFLSINLCNWDGVVAEFLNEKWKAPSQFIDPEFRKFCLYRSPSKFIWMVEDSSKHFCPLVNQRKKSISLLVASTEIETGVPVWPKLTKPVEIFVWCVNGSVDFFNWQVSCAATINGTTNRVNTKIFFIKCCWNKNSHCCQDI